MKTIRLKEWLEEGTKIFGSKNPLDWKFKCISCGHVQSGCSILDKNSNLKKDDVANWMFMSCEGRVNGKGVDAMKISKKDKESGKYAENGCNWTLGGLFNFSDVVVVDEWLKEHPVFEFSNLEG